MKGKLSTFLSKLLFLVLIISSHTLAQNGAVSGIVTDDKTGDYLPSANVIVLDTKLGAATDLQGAFRIANVPPGNYTLQFKYIGYEDHSTNVTVEAGKTLTVKIRLIPSQVILGDIIVSGLRQGQAKAISVQKEAENIKNVVSREQMETFPDANAAEVLQRIPGVYIQRSGGDGRYVMIRGTEPRLSSVTVNGEALASTRNQERYSQLDIVGSNQMSFLEVIKAITPDMDANAIGGSVNIITKSAFDYPGTNLKLVAGSGYAQLDEMPLYQGNLNYSTRLGIENNIGISFTANYDRKTRGADNMEFTWDEKTDANKNKIPFALAELNLMDYNNIKDRYGLGGGLEYRFDDENKIFANVMWNKFDDNQDRGRIRLRVDQGTYLDPSGTLISKSKIARENKWRLEELLQTAYNLGGENHWGFLKMNYNFSYSRGEENHLPDITSTWDFNYKPNLMLDLAELRYPKWTITNTDIPQGAESDFKNYKINSFDYRNTVAFSTEKVARLDLEHPYSFFEFPAKLRGGFKYHETIKDRNDDRWGYNSLINPALTMADFASDIQNNNFMGNHYVFGPQVNYKTVLDFLEANRSDNTKLKESFNWYDSEGQSYKASEKVMAYYLMTDVKLGNFSVLAGLRHEFTGTDYTGTSLSFDNSGNFSSYTYVSEKRNYNNFFPMVHVSYELTDMTKLRAAYTTSIARPNFFDLAPMFFIEPKSSRFRHGNPDLLPTESQNIDVMAEHYFRGIGLASGSFFYKSLKGIIFESRKIAASGAYVGYEERTPVNGGDATLYGFELNWQQELTFLPGFLSGFAAYLNYTHTWADAQLLDRSGYLPGQSGDIGNISLAYEKYAFKARVSYAYQGKFLLAVGKNEAFDVFNASHGQVDLSVSYNFWKNFELFGEMVNLNNAQQYEYLGTEDRPYLQELYSWWSRFGLKWNL